MKSHYTYELVALRRDVGKPYRYIGVRSCDCAPADDDYWGSGKALPSDVRDTCIKFITGIYPTRERAMKAEVYLHDKHDVARSCDYWNAAKASECRLGFTTEGVKLGPHTAEHCAKIGAASKRRGRSDKNRKALLAANKGVPKTAEHRAKLSAAMTGKTPSDKTRALLSAASMGNTNRLGKKHSDETRKRMSVAKKGKPGKPHTLASRIKNGLAHKGKTISAATRAKQSAANSGQVRTPEQCARIKVAAQKREDTRRQRRAFAFWIGVQI